MKSTTLPNLNHIGAVKREPEPVDRCRTKGYYSNKGAAERSAVKRLAKPNAPPALRAYECPDCGMWHLTRWA
jgi:hypothetical protein